MPENATKATQLTKEQKQILDLAEREQIEAYLTERKATEVKT